MLVTALTMRFAATITAALLLLGSARSARAQWLAAGCTEGETPAWITSVRGARSVLPGSIPAGELPPCASPLMRSVHAAAMRAAAGSTVAANLITTSRNAAEREALVQGPRIFAKMSDLIASAEREVLIQNWRWDTKARGHATVMEGLRRLSQNRRLMAPNGPPVEVKLLVNVRAFEDPKMLEKLGAEIEKLELDPRLVRVQLGGHNHFGLGALHSKVTIVDGRSAVATGANVQSNHDTFDDNYDLGFTLHGDVAGSMRAEFADAWSRSDRWVCGGRGSLVLDVFGTGMGPCWKRAERMDPLPLSYLVPTPSLVRACVPMMVVTRGAAQSPFANDDHNPQNQAFLAAIRGARTNIRILTPNINDEAVKDALAAAIARGVTIQLVTGKGYQDSGENIPTRGGSNHRAFASILEKARALGAADPCSRFQPRWYVREPGRAPVVGNVAHSIHAKYLSVDGALAIVGSANLDEQSFNNSREVNIVVDDASTTRAWDRQVFEENWRNGVTFEGCR